MKKDYRSLRAAKTIPRNLSEMNFDYEYPGLPNLKPGSEPSKKICEEIQNRIEASRSHTDPLVDRHQEMDRIVTAYMPESDYDNAVKSKDSRKQLTFVVPMTFAMREMFLTYLTQVFLMGDSIHKYKGVGNTEARIAGAMLERVVARQASWFNHRLHWNTTWSDSLMYGRGRAVINWSKRKGFSARQEKVEELVSMALNTMGVDVSAGDKVRYVEEITVAEGCELQPIDWYQCIFDPSVSPNDTQKAEYGGWFWATNGMDILRREKDPEEKFFNGRYAYEYAKGGYGRSIYWSANDERLNGSTEHQYGSDMNVSRRLDIATMVVDIIPEEWFGSGYSDSPEKWKFSVAGDEIVVQAHRMNHRHGQFPWIDIAPNDGFRLSPIGHLGVTYAYQQFASWLMKSRAEEVITTMLGMLFVDNSRIDIDYIQNAEQGQIIPVRNAAYGEGGIERFVHQLQINPVTTNHLNDIANIEAAARFGNGTDSLRMDDMPERPTAAGVNAVTGGQFSRLSRLAFLIDEQGMRPAAFQMAMNTQQWMGEEVYVPIIGSYEQELRKLFEAKEPGAQVKATPWDVDTPFEVESYSGARPGADDTTALSEMVKTMMAVDGIPQQIAADYRVSSVFADVMRKLGIENIDDYRIEVMPDEQVVAQQQAGTLVGAPNNMVGFPGGAAMGGAQ